MSFMPDFHDLEAIRKLQRDGLKWTIDHCLENSPFYKRRFEEVGLEPGAIKGLEDLRRLPFTTAKDLQEGYPFPLRAVSFEKIVRVHASSGTTGKRKVLCYTQKDIDDWAEMFARCYEIAGLTQEDRVQIAVGYGVWTAGVGFQLGCERFGAMAIPAGPGNIDMQCQFLEDFQSTVLCCTASMGLLMAEEIQRRGLRDRIALRKMIYGSERSSDAMRERISQLMGLEEMLDIPGLTELYGPGTGMECHRHEGIHYWADYYILEILDPKTLEPVPPGEIGEMVVTTLKKEGAPLIRYRTRDLTRWIDRPCSCGNPFPMHDRILGRSDDMITFRAVNIYPGQIDHILSNTTGLGSEYQIILSRGEDGRDRMAVRVERDIDGDKGRDSELNQQIAGEIKKQIMVSADVEIVDYGELPRSERKSKRVLDHRPD